MQRVRLLALLAALLGAALLIGWVLGDSEAPVPNAPLAGDANDDERTPAPVRTAEGSASGTRTGTDEAGSPGGARAVASGLTGEVLDETGRGIAGATVELTRVDPRGLRGAPYQDLESLASTTAERDGRFELKGALAGRWLRVTASHAGYASVGRLVASAGGHVVLVLPPAGALQLAIVDTEDHPVADATVHATAGESTHVATSNAKGQAAFERLPPGEVRLRILMPEHGAARAGPFRIRAGERTEQLVVVARGVRVAGVVVDDGSGKPVSDAFVRIARPGHAESTTTNSKGAFGPLAGGGLGERILIAVDAPGYAAALEAVTLRASGTQTTEIRLLPAAAWSGRVVDAQGRAVANAAVAYSTDGIAVPARQTETTTDEQGGFVLGAPPRPAPGRRVVLIARAGSARGALALRPDQPAPNPLVLTLSTGAAVHGRVHAAKGTPLPGAVVRLQPAWDQIPQTTEPDAATSLLHAFNSSAGEGLAGATAADGSWQILGVPLGPYSISIAYGQQRHLRAEPLTIDRASVAAGTETLAGQDLTGAVVDARGEPIAGVAILVQAASDRRQRSRTTSDASGDFRVAALTPGTYRVSALLAGRSPVSETLEVRDGVAAYVTLTMDEPAALELSVLREGAAYAGLLTLSFGEAGSGRAAARRHTLRVRGGKANLPDVAPGTWTLEAFAPGGLRARVVEVAIDAGRTTPVRVALEPGASLHTRVLTVDGTPVPNAQLVLTHTPTGGRLNGTADADGRAPFQGLAPGEYALAISGRGGAASVERFALAAGESRDLDATLERAGTLEVRVVDARGRGVAGARVRFAHGQQAVRTRRPPLTDRDGVVRQADLPVGAIRVEARSPSGLRGVAHAEVSAGKQSSVQIVLTPAAPK